MKSAIEEIIEGKFAQLEKIKPTERQNQLLQEITDSDNKVIEYLNGCPEAAKAYQIYKDLSAEYAAENIIPFFKEAFRDGFRIALDALDEN